MAPAPLARTLQDRGLRLTRSRKAVLQVLAETSEHLKVAEVHRRARQIDPRVSLASVYRTMDLLARLRLVQHVHVEHRHRHYARITDRHGHHLVCSGCGRVVEFTDCRADRLARLLARRTKFRIEGHSLEFFGRCPACRPRATRSPNVGARGPGAGQGAPPRAARPRER